MLLHAPPESEPTDVQPAAGAFNDQIMVKGQIVKVLIIGFDAEGVAYRSELGTGKTTTAHADLEGAFSRAAFRIVCGDGDEAVGRLLGSKEGRLLTEDSPTTIIHVPVEEIQSCVLAGGYDRSR